MVTKVKGEPPTGSEQAADLLGNLVGAGSAATRQMEPDGSESLRLRLDADASASQRARRAIETLGDRIGGQAIADLRAVVSELVAISLSSSSKSSIEIRLELREGGICGEICRPGGVMGAISSTGNALRIIGALVEEWGISADQTGAWFRLTGPN